MLRYQKFGRGRGAVQGAWLGYPGEHHLLLLKEKEMNMNEIAARLQITNGALTSHIRKLEEAGLIRVTQDSVGHGNQKVCSVLETRILVEIGTQEETGEGSIFRAEIPVGQYSDYQVFPTCGISTTKKMIGEVDDPRYLPIRIARKLEFYGFRKAMWNIWSRISFRQDKR